MKMNFFKWLAEKIRQPFKKEEPPSIFAPIEKEATEPQSATESAEENAEPRRSGKYTKQAQNCLFKDKAPIGKPFGHRAEIRVLYVNNFVEAFLFFLRMCDQRLLDYRQAGGHLSCHATFPDGSGKLAFTDKVTCRNKAVIAVLKIEICGLQPQISEIRFELKH
ncbi:hypothetical protein [Phocaeicola sp.]